MAEGEDPLLLLLLVVVLVAATLRPGEVAVRGSDGVRLAAAVVVVATPGGACKVDPSSSTLLLASWLAPFPSLVFLLLR